MQKNQDKKLTKKDKLTKRKVKNLKLTDISQDLINKQKIKMTKKTVDRIKDCSSYLEFLADSKLANYRLLGGIMCNNRFCPICSKNKAVKDSIALKVITKHLKYEQKRSFLFVTLTAPNVVGDVLNDEIIRYNLAFKKMIERKLFKKFIKGYLRKLEVTYNKKTNTYHPHLHILISVTSSYFNSGNYVKRDIWLKNWQDVMQDDSITQVDVRRLKDKNIDKSILELTKYVAKDNDYLINTDVFKNFYTALKGKRMYSFGGDFKIAVDLYKKDKIKEYQDDNLLEFTKFIQYFWQTTKFKQRVTDLTKNKKIDDNKTDIFD